jgi:hypothetical protein
MSNYTELLKDPRWQKMRLEIFTRDNWECQICHSKESTLNIHHTYYKKWGTPPWDYPDESLITLCEQCHEIEGQELSELTHDFILILKQRGYMSRHFKVLGNLILWDDLSPDEQLEKLKNLLGVK